MGLRVKYLQAFRTMKVSAPILALFFWPLLGCAIIPVPTAEHNFCHVAWGDNCGAFITRGEITEETLEFMRPGTTTREETLLNLGGPDLVWRDETVFSYQWLMVGGYVFWAWSLGVGAGGGSSYAWFNSYVLLVEFDADNVVQRCAVKRLDGQTEPISGLIEKWLAEPRSDTTVTCDRTV
jgi:hypothetical protein